MKRPTKNSKTAACNNLIRLFCALTCIHSISLAAQESPTNQIIRSEVRHIGSAEVRAVTKDSGFFPGRQPEVYWHNENWKIDLLPLSSPNAAFTLRVTSEDMREKTVILPDRIAQIDSISQTSNNKAIITAELGWMAQALCIVDLKQGKVIDLIGIYAPSVSPDRNFILYNNWYTPHVGGENIFRLYDVRKTPAENTCGYDDNDPHHKRLSDDLRGFQVYPQKPEQSDCTEVDDNDDNMAVSEYLWSQDSRRVVFADVKSQAIHLILVILPEDENNQEDKGNDNANYRGSHSTHRDVPQTFIYTFSGSEDVCADATICDHNNIRSLAWGNNAVNAVLVKANPNGAAITKSLTIPLSKFLPLEKAAKTRTEEGKENQQ